MLNVQILFLRDLRELQRRLTQKLPRRLQLVLQPAGRLGEALLARLQAGVSTFTRAGDEAAYLELRILVLVGKQLLLVVVPRALDDDVAQKLLRRPTYTRQVFDDASEQSALQPPACSASHRPAGVLPFFAILVWRVDLDEHLADAAEGFEHAEELVRRRAAEVNAGEAALEVGEGTEQVAKFRKGERGRRGVYRGDGVEALGDKPAEGLVSAGVLSGRARRTRTLSRGAAW